MLQFDLDASEGRPTGPVNPVVVSPKAGETFYSDWKAIKRWRRRLLGYMYRLPDTGWFGLKPLRTHIAVCGFRRSGTTLLQMMLEYALPNARRFGREVEGWRAATYHWRNHEVMISKAPDDIFRLHGLLQHYEHRAARLRPIVLIRDPRDVLTSRLANTDPGSYCVNMGLWRQYRKTLRTWLNSPDVLLVRYEGLVTNTVDVQTRVEAFTGEPSRRWFADFHNEDRADFDTLPLNGLRPVDTNSIGRWRRPEHRQRIAALLRDDPGFADTVIDLGYEFSTDWVAQCWNSHSGSRGEVRSRTVSSGISA